MLCEWVFRVGSFGRDLFLVLNLWGVYGLCSAVVGVVVLIYAALQEGVMISCRDWELGSLGYYGQG
jgi:hypothetical protein